MDAYGMLAGLGVVGVLDTLLLAKKLPETEKAKLSKTDAGNVSYANKSLVKGLLGWGEDELTWHQAVDDARGTAEVLRTTAMRALLPRAHLESKALVKLEQLVLAVHHQHNERVKKANPSAPPAGKTRKPVGLHLLQGHRYASPCDEAHLAEVCGRRGCKSSSGCRECPGCRTLRQLGEDELTDRLRVRGWK